MGLGQPERAIEDATEALRLDPFLAEAYVNRGSAYMALGQPQRAIEDATAAIWLNPGLRDYGAVVPLLVLARAHLNRGLAYQDLDQPERAVQDYDEAIRLDPRLAQAYVVRTPSPVRMSNARRSWASIPNFWRRR